MTDPNLPDAPLSSWATGLMGRCPRCGRGAMFAGVLKVADRCNACGLDLRGHDAGDRVLQEFSALILKHIRTGDKFARWGGEEFVLLCFQTEQRGLVTLAEKLRTVVANHVFEDDTEPLMVTASIGVAWVKPDESFDSAFKRADLALYEAKSTTRNRVVIAE